MKRTILVGQRGRELARGERTLANNVNRDTKLAHEHGWLTVGAENRNAFLEIISHKSDGMNQVSIVADDNAGVILSPMS
ncbi:MAG: hypothetical protein L6Q71_08810, partial [Planctomycetes bacterium]|nr:hypothetical protein [Planctomycetota bacterium]